MKYGKFLRMLALVVVLSLLAIPVSAIPALAAESLSLDPNEGDINDSIDTEGRGFDDDDSIYLYFSNEELDIDDDINDLESYEYLKTKTTGAEGDSDAGDFDTSFRVPDDLTDGDETVDVAGGTYYVYASSISEGKILAMEEFTVLAGSIKEIDPDSGIVGTEVEISGEYFEGNDDITIYFDDEEVDIEDGDEETDSDGDFKDALIIIPESTAGEHTIAVEDESEHRAEVEFTVESEMTIGSTSGEIDKKITVAGTGFKGDDEITVNVGGIEVITEPATIETDEYGSFSGRFVVPDRDPDTYEVEVSDGTNEETANFTILVSLSMNISPTSGNIGTTITITGTGFVANGTATIKYGDTNVATVPITSDKTLSASFDAPASSGGAHNIVVSDGTNTLTATFTMESTAPSIPAPLKPEMGVKAESPVNFDWKDVEDPSGVTYTLQVATDEEFTTSSIVLEKKKLTKSEYTVTAVEKLESTKEEAPYYWRVKSIDGASNESEWSSPGSFHVGGFGFALTGWILYTICGVGALLFGIIGFWIGRRTAYSYY
ncbi:MAG TPA: IPT/TIG domain-containing protein [Dehalococcoidales bacterium]|nr:IPT/TIG domain-containing protein [Dehalococcoidales bacterium]